MTMNLGVMVPESRTTTWPPIRICPLFHQRTEVAGVEMTNRIVFAQILRQDDVAGNHNSIR